MTELTMGEPLSFENLGCGAAEEKFEDALKEVLVNILDPNTDPKTVREVVMKVKVKPNEERSEAVVSIHVHSKLSPARDYPTRIFIGRSVEGQPEAHEVNANQYPLFPKEKGNVTAMAVGKE
ncbi:MAG: hypothetical protein PHV97_05340 [Candidatus Omnitrophica bacterium]|nr:hypothetical protein [Candidatus Omnitrophota bacterium]